MPRRKKSRPSQVLSGGMAMKAHTKAEIREIFGIAGSQEFNAMRVHISTDAIKDPAAVDIMDDNSARRMEWGTGNAELGRDTKRSSEKWPHN